MSEVRPTTHILRATGIIGAASLINIAVGLVRTKIVAVVLGAVGVGRIGILISLMTTASATAAWGISNTSAQCLAGASTDDELAIARRSVVYAAVVLGLVGTVAVYFARLVLARLLFKDPAAATAIGWTSLGIGLSVIALAQNGFLTGLRRVGDLARVSAASGAISTLLTVPMVLILRERAILPYVLLGPTIAAIVGAYFIVRIDRPVARPKIRSLAPQWRRMMSLGTALTIASLVVLCGQLAIRVIVQRVLGLPAVGLFQASFAISVNYIGLALGALATDYYPRLVPHIREPDILRRMINGQVFVSLLLAAPLIVLAIGFAPWLIALLYAPSFAPAGEMLRWQMLGDVMKIAGWPLSFVLLASGRGTVFALNEGLTMALGVGITAALVPKFGIAGAGLAYLAMYAAYLASLNWLIGRQIGRIWETRTVRCWCLLACCSMVVLAASALNEVAGMLVSLAATAGMTLLALRQLPELVPARLRRLLPRWI